LSVLNCVETVHVVFAFIQTYHLIEYPRRFDGSWHLR